MIDEGTLRRELYERLQVIAANLHAEKSIKRTLELLLDLAGRLAIARHFQEHQNRDVRLSEIEPSPSLVGISSTPAGTIAVLKRPRIPETGDLAFDFSARLKRMREDNAMLRGVDLSEIWYPWLHDNGDRIVAVLSAFGDEAGVSDAEIDAAAIESYRKAVIESYRKNHPSK